MWTNVLVDMETHFFSFQKKGQKSLISLKDTLISFQNTQKQTKVVYYNEPLKAAYFKVYLLQIFATITSKQ